MIDLHVDEFPLPNYFPTASEDRFLLLSERDAHAEEVCTAPQEVADTGSTSEGSAKKKGRTVVVTTEDMHKRRNDVKARTTLLLALPDERQLRFSKYKTAQELWAAILKTFGGNEATKKTKKNQLKQQYGNFKAEGKETLEKTFNRLQAIRNRSDLDTTSLDDLYNHLKVYEPEVQKKSESNSQNMAFISSAKTSSGKEEVNTASFSTVITQVSPASADVATINEDDIEEIDIEWNMALLSMRADRFWKKTRKKITIQGWDWSYMDNEEENHALVADEEAPIEFALMAKSIESKDNRIERLTKELEELKKEKEGLDSKLTGFQSAFKDLDTLLGSQSDLQNNDSSVSKKGDSSKSIMSKPMIKFVKATNSTTEVKISKVETVRKPSVMYAEMYKNTTKSPKEEQGKTWPKNNNTHKSMSPRNIFHKTDRTPMRTNRPNMNVAQPKRTSFTKPAHSYVRRPFQRTSAARTQFKVPRVSTVNTKFPTVNKKIPLGNSQNVIDDKGYWDSGCSRHMTGNISYLLDYEPYDGGYVSFRQGGGKITGKGIIKTVVVAGTTSTNFSGTKDAASQDVKKDVSSLRYIALLNWFHDAHLESSTSNAQDACNADALESSNMENNISASPTLTFRIYKDHPKSQIIGPVDIAVQTRTKSKEMEEQSFIATIHHKTNPALLQFCLFSCFLSQEEPKKISDAIKDPSWVKAMQEELLQFKI
nr:ribonuclease H-like domain-containing protein [Tanacetum cinerariifolium]